MSNDELKVIPANENEYPLFFTDNKSEAAYACIGHLRIDFDRGNSFHSTWFEHNPGLHKQDFDEEIGYVINILRRDLLKDRKSMKKFIEHNSSLEMKEGSGYKVLTEKYAYYLRCKPMNRSYDCYCYCYKKSIIDSMY